MYTPKRINRETLSNIAPFKINFLGGIPPNPPSKARRFAPSDTSRKRDVHFTPISSPPCLNMDLRPWLAATLALFYVRNEYFKSKYTPILEYLVLFSQKNF